MYVNTTHKVTRKLICIFYLVYMCNPTFSLPHSAFNDDMVSLFDKINFNTLPMSDFRARISRKIGLPVGVFRLMSEAGVEMFDCHTLYDYGVGLGSTIRLDTWDGWNDFLNLAVMGFSSHVMASLMAEDVVAKYQMKVAMYMAAHFGHVDLAVSLQRCKWVTLTKSLFSLLSPAYILTISPRFTVGAPVFTQRLRKTIRRINSRLRRCCVNTGAATVNRGEIVSMYAGLQFVR